MDENSVGINWFPGHMAKTRRKIEEALKSVDAVAEIIDARIPVSSRNTDLNALLSGKKRIIILNKCDMADNSVTDKWIAYYKSQGIPAISCDCKTGNGINAFKTAVKQLLSEEIAQNTEKGMAGKSIKVMVVGIPNVGKSTFINKLAGRSKAKAENRPGVTRGNQWFTVEKGLELLDTPGILPPKLSDQTAGEHLAFTGAIKDTILDTEFLAVRLLDILSDEYKYLLTNRYGELDFNCDSYTLLQQIGNRRGMIVKGGETDTLRAANMLLEEYRSCKIGKITLERVI